MTEKLQNLVSQAKECESKKDWDGAIRCWSQVIDLPEISKEYRAGAFNSRGNAFANKGELDTAIRDYDNALKIKPDFAEALYNRGLAFVDKGELDAAIRDFDDVLKLEPDNANALYNRGAVFTEKGELDAAIRDFDHILKFIKPDFAEALYNRGLAFAKKGELDAAIRDFDDAIKSKSDFAEAFNNRGNAFAKKGELDAAIRDFDDAIKSKPDLAEAFNNRGAAFIDNGELDRAIRDFDDAIKSKPDFAEAFNNRGNAFAKKGELDSAIRDYDHAIKLNPNYAKALNNRGIAFTKKGELERAISDFDDAIRIKPDLADAHSNRAISLARIHARETEKKYQKEHEEQLRQIKESHEQALRQVTDPVEIIKSYQDRGDKYVKQINSINWGSRFFIFLLSVILIGGFLAITFVVFYAWGYLAFGSSDCDIPNCSAPGVVISTDRGKVSFAGLLAIAPIMLALFTACFPFIAQLFNLWKEKRRLQVCVEDYFRKQTLVRYTLLAKDEHKQRLIAITHAHFATRSAAEFLAGWKQESEENSHPLTDAIGKAIRGAKDAASRKPTEKPSS